MKIQRSFVAQSNKVVVILAVIAMAFAVYARIVLSGMPFERDEGGFAYIAQQLWQGGLLYTQLPDSKPPLLYLIYALFVSLPFDPVTAVHAGAMIFHFTAMLVLWKWASNYMPSAWSFLLTACCSLYCISWQVAGFAAHATQLLLLPALAGCYLLRHNPNESLRQTAFAGLLFGLAFCIKQQAFFLPAGGAILIWLTFERQQIKHSLTLFLTAALPFLCCLVWFAAKGRFGDFWENVFVEPAGQAIGFQEKLKLLTTHLELVCRHWWLFWGLALAGFFRMLRSGDGFQKSIVWFFILSLVGVVSAGPAYPHYFVLCLPWLAWGFITSAGWLVDKWRYTGILVVFTALFLPIVLQTQYWFAPDYRDIERKVYGMNPFPEMQSIGSKLRNELIKSGNEKVAVVGSEPELYVYTGKTSPLKYIYHYGLLQGGETAVAKQQKYLSDWNAAQPEWVILPSPDIDRFSQVPVFHTIIADLKTNYSVAGIIDIYPGHTVYNWSPQPTDINKSPSWVLVFRKK